jgi:hypothetical protein
MEVKRIKGEDLKEVNSWYKGWGQPQIPAHALPRGGYMVSGIAAGFCYLTDSSIGIIEGYISNPDSTPEQRSEALDEITQTILRYAARNEVSLLIAYATREEIGERAMRHGFKPCGGYMGYVKEIHKWDS